MFPIDLQHALPSPVLRSPGLLLGVAVALSLATVLVPIESSLSAHGVLLALLTGAILTAVLLHRTRLRLEAMRTAEERLRLAIEAAEIGIFDCDLRTGAIEWSDTLRALHRLSADWEPTHEAAAQLIHPEDRPAALGAVQRLLHHPGKVRGEWRVFRSDGTVRRTAVTAQLLVSSDGKPRRLLGVVQDVTARRRAEASARLLAEVSATLGASLQVEENLARIAAQICHGAADCCLIELAEGGRTRRLWARSAEGEREAPGPAPTWRPIDGAPLVAFPSEPAPLLVPDLAAEPGALPDLAAELAQVAPGRRPRSVVAAPLKDGPRHIGALLLVSLQPGRRYGRQDLNLCRDLACRASLAIENARHFRAARQATHARDEILAVVAHDLRTPLHATYLAAGLVQRRLAARPECQRERVLLDSILRSSRRMNRLIQDLLDVTHMEVRGFSVETAPRRCEDLLAEAEEGMRDQALEADLTLRTEVAPGLPPVMADRERVLQVLFNLIGNAIKFTPAGGTIVTSAVRWHDGEVCFRVQDTGKGIPESHQPHLFEPFWQGDQNDRRGAGLGLAICKGIIDAHVGKIWVESVEGQGSTLCFTLPIAQAPSSPEPQPAPSLASA